MRELRGAVLDAPLSVPSRERRTGPVPPEPLVERPLSGRLPKGRRLPGPVLVTGDASGRTTLTSGAGGSGSFFRACILLLLQEHPAHGYEILERLSSFGFDSGDSGWLYRTLRAYEREAVVVSTWQISASGPPRRVYSLTGDGYALLDAWASSLRASKRGIDEFLDRHGRAVGRRLDRE